MGEFTLSLSKGISCFCLFFGIIKNFKKGIEPILFSIRFVFFNFGKTRTSQLK